MGGSWAGGTAIGARSVEPRAPYVTAAARCVPVREELEAPHSARHTPWRKRRLRQVCFTPGCADVYRRVVFTLQPPPHYHGPLMHSLPLLWWRRRCASPFPPCPFARKTPNLTLCVRNQHWQLAAYSSRARCTYCPAAVVHWSASSVACPKFVHHRARPYPNPLPCVGPR